MLQEQVIPIDFGGGADTKTDPKLVVPGKMLRLENGVFTNPKRIAKRNGYTALPTAISDGTTLSSPKLVKDLGDQLIAQDSGKFLSLSRSQSAWISSGNYISTELSRSIIDQAHQASGYADVAVLGNYALYGWSTASAAASTITSDLYSKVYAAVVDIQTGNIIKLSGLLSTSTSVDNVTPVRCVNLGGTTLAIAYVKSDSSAVVMRIVTFSGSGVVSFGSEVSVTTAFTPLTGTAASWDIVATSAGATILFSSNPGGTVGVSLGNIDTTGAVTAATNIADASAVADGLHIAQTSNGNLWAYWTEALGGPRIAGNIVYAVYSSSLLTNVLSKTTLTALATPYYVSNMIAVSNSATQQTLYYGVYVAGVPTTYSDKCFSRTATSAGVVGSQTTVACGVIPYSRPFTSGGFNYAVFIYRGVGLTAPTSKYIGFQTQPTFFVLQLDPSQSIPVVVARFGAGIAAGQSTLEGTLGFMPSCPVSTGSKFLFACGLQIQGLSAADQFYGLYFGSLSAVYSYAIDFNSADAYVATNVGGVQILNGGMMSLYDGITCAEFGFHLAPEIIKLSQTNTANGAIANGTYSYIAIYQWTDALGNLHQSPPSLPVSITTTGVNDTVTATVSTAILSKKPGVSVALFRTQNAQTVYYQVSNPVDLPSADPTSAASLSIVDISADASIAGNTQAYTYPASSVLENSVPPPSMAMAAHNNRLWVRDDENRNTYWYTKSIQNLVGLSPSAFLTNQIDKKFGDISSLAEMDEKIVIGKKSGFLVQSGDGANDIGSGSTLSFPQIVPSDVGVSEMKSVILTPKGLMFKSINGIYLLDRSLNVSYMGAEVEAYNSQTITSANLVPGKSQIRFLCSSGLTLVYDYIFNQWSTFTNHTGVSAPSWNSTYVYTTGTSILQEAAGTYTDNGSAFSLLARTSWLALAGVQGFQRVKRLIMLGDFINGNSASHALSISAAYDFSTTFQPAVSYAFGAVSASGVFQYRERLAIQKCDAISLLIQETTTGSGAEYIDLTNISFEAGIKKGLNKLGGAYSVG